MYVNAFILIENISIMGNFINHIPVFNRVFFLSLYVV
jgi:hypothetical protein